MSMRAPCTKCVMDTSDPEISFDDYGVCNYCRGFEKKFGLVEQGGPFYSFDKLEKKSDDIKYKQKNKDYDIIVGLSGGVDSSYTALLAKQLGLRAAYVHFDSGWNSAVATENIKRSLDYLGGDLFTYVCNWQSMRDAQKAFFLNGEINCDIPQDHAFLAALIHFSKKLEVPYIFSGHNLATEYVMPMSWGYSSHDNLYLKRVVQKHANNDLMDFPFYNPYKYLINQRLGLGLDFVRPLNHIPYDKEELENEMKSKFSWQGYAVKHGESKFTYLFQSYYLVEKFGIDKRKAHLSSAILSGLKSRDQALDVLKSPPYDVQKIEFQLQYFCQKLGVEMHELLDLVKTKQNDMQNKRSLLLSFARAVTHRGVNYAVESLFTGKIKYE